MKDDPLYKELKRYPPEDATAFLLGAVAAEESGVAIEAADYFDRVIEVMSQLSGSSSHQVFVFIEAFDRALGILAATGRTYWVEVYGAFAESIGRAGTEILDANPQFPEPARLKCEAMTPFSGVATYAGKSYTIFDPNNPRSDAELRSVLMSGLEVRRRDDEVVARLAGDLPETHPVRALLDGRSATAGNDRWVKPYLLLRARDKHGATQAR